MKVSNLPRTMTLSLPLALVLACGQSGNSDEPEVSEAAALQRDADASRSSEAYILRQARGQKAQDIQQAVDRFRADLGGGNNLGAVGTQPQGHREINWDGVPANLSAPNFFPGDFFKARGALFHSPGGRLQVSAQAKDTIEVAFANINPAFSQLFRFFSPEKLFSGVDERIIDVKFTVPGSDVPATVKGFGAVFTDVDLKGPTEMEFYDMHGKRILELPVPEVRHANGSLSFVGVKFTNGQTIARVRMKLGNVALSEFYSEKDGQDAVATDDFLYAEPQKMATRR